MSVVSMTSPYGLVIGTAGHIDHGKTSLIRALTGIDTDRLAEEKRRGISIDLGFAHLTLPDGRRISFVDVPGHERFIRNMLAGAGGIQAVLLIVAANESVKPQTREHFDIARLLGIRHGIILVTKADVASPEQIQTALGDVRALCAGSFLAGAPLIVVSAATSEGLPELKQELSSLANRIAPRYNGGLARLPVDRSFALKGFGTVVTGTLWSGKLRLGDTVQIHPSNKSARVRGLQVHGEPVETAVAGQRTAVNLAGIDSSEIRRGFILNDHDGLEPSKLMDISVEWLNQPDIPRNREHFTLHIGTSEMPAALKVLDKKPSRTLARIWLSGSFPALPGDRFVLRRSSPPLTVAGGYIIDAFPPRRVNRVKTIARLETLAEADPAKRLEILVQENAKASRLPDLIRSTGMRPGELKSLIGGNHQLVLSEPSQRVVTKSWIEDKRRELIEWLLAFHVKNPSAIGAPVSQARLGVDPDLAPLIFEHLSAIRLQGDTVSLATHKAQFSDREAQTLARIELGFRQAGFQPPAVSEILKSAGTDMKNGRGLLESLVKSQKLVRVAEDLVFHADVLSHIRKSISTHKGRKFSVSEFKDWTQISRKYAIPLLEYLDRQHVTRREGDARIVL